MTRAPAGRHGGPRRPVRRRFRVAALAVATALVVLLGVVVAVGVPWLADRGQEANASGCDGPPVRVGADPLIAGSIVEATRDLGPWLEPGECLDVKVRSVESDELATQLGLAAGTGFAGPVPDIWVPDSSLWLPVAGGTEIGRMRLPEAGTSIASSPVVVAMPAAAAGRAGWPDRQPTWSGLLAASDGPVAMPDPRTDAPALATLLGVMAQRDEPLAAVARLFTVPVTTDAAAARLAASGHVSAVPTSEASVIRANETSGRVSVVAGYARGVRPALDFPLLAIADDAGDVPDATARAEQVLSDVLLDASSQELFATEGLRTPDGTLDPTWEEHSGVLDRATAGTAGYEARRVRSVVERWTSVGRRFRLLVLVDRSASMAQSLPGTTLSKAELAESALDDLVRSLAPDSDMGLWSFTTGLVDGDTEVLVDTGPVGAVVGGTTRRDSLLAGVNQLDPKPGGGTPLYDAVLAAFRSAQRDYAYGRLNAVVVVSDGRNLDSPSISLTELLDALRLEFDGVRPVRVITIAYGAEADDTTLRRISSITGGRSYAALTSSDISAVLRQAIADL